MVLKIGLVPWTRQRTSHCRIIAWGCKSIVQRQCGVVPDKRLEQDSNRELMRGLKRKERTHVDALCGKCVANVWQMLRRTGEVKKNVL